MSQRNAKPTIEDGLLALKHRWPELFRPDDEDSPVFVLAAGWRSGSTLLQRLLSKRCLVWGEPYGHAWPIQLLADQIRCFTDRWPEPHHFYRGQQGEALASTFIANLYPAVRDLMRAHRGFFDRLFAEPARSAGHDRWGLKEVRLDADHALYLRWVYPRARFLFLVRNPYDAWRSYAARAAQGWRWYNRWPDEPLTARSFAAHWNRVVSSVLEGHRKVDGLLIRYEDLVTGQVAAIEGYLGFELSREAGRINPGDGGPTAFKAISEDDACALEDELGRLAASLGYYPGGHREEAFSRAATAQSSLQNARARCAILVPYRRFIEPACESGLRELERRGFTVRRVAVSEGIALTRSQAATDALHAGFGELMWIDPDLEFEPDMVDQLRSLGLTLACGVYARQRPEGLTWNVFGETGSIANSASGNPSAVPYAECGFLLSWREVYLAIQQSPDVSPCRRPGESPFLPFFLPLIVHEDGDAHYLPEGFSFCVRARTCGYSIAADKSVRPRPIISLPCGWETLGSPA